MSKAKATPQQIADRDTRTTDVGFFNFADSYLLCGKTLTSQKISGLRFPDPIEYLFYHSIELYLKAFLRSKGFSAHELQYDHRHSLVELRNEAKTQGLSLDEKEFLRIEFIQEQKLVIGSRYITNGAKQFLPLEALLGTAERIRAKVQKELIQAGVSIRSEKVAPHVDFDDFHRLFPGVSEDK